jgi:hypothetical protein
MGAEQAQRGIHRLPDPGRGGAERNDSVLNPAAKAPPAQILRLIELLRRIDIFDFCDIYRGAARATRSCRAGPRE